MGDMGATHGVHQDRSWQPGQVPSPQPGAGQTGSTEAAPAPGTRHQYPGQTTSLMF